MSRVAGWPLAPGTRPGAAISRAESRRIEKIEQKRPKQDREEKEKEEEDGLAKDAAETGKTQTARRSSQAARQSGNQATGAARAPCLPLIEQGKNKDRATRPSSFLFLLSCQLRSSTSLLPPPSALNTTTSASPPRPRPPQRSPDRLRPLPMRGHLA